MCVLINLIQTCKRANDYQFFDVVKEPFSESTFGHCSVLVLKAVESHSPKNLTKKSQDGCGM